MSLRLAGEACGTVRVKYDIYSSMSKYCKQQLCATADNLDIVEAVAVTGKFRRMCSALRRLISHRCP